MQRRFLALAALILLAALLAACRSESDTPVAEDPQPAGGSAVAAPPPALAGTFWVVESLGEGDDQVESLPNVQSTLGFLTDRYGGNGGCNFFVGVYSTDGASVRLETPARTGAACAEAPESLTQENVFMSALATTARYDIVDSRLQLFASNDQLMLTLAPAEPAPLQGTDWSLQFVNVDTQWEEILPETQITMRAEDGELSGTSGCNHYFASVSEQDGRITISDLSVTEMACLEPEGVMEQETLYLSLLEQAELVRQFPQSVELRSADGAPLLFYGAARASE